MSSWTDDFSTDHFANSDYDVPWFSGVEGTDFVVASNKLTMFQSSPRNNVAWMHHANAAQLVFSMEMHLPDSHPSVYADGIALVGLGVESGWGGDTEVAVQFDSGQWGPGIWQGQIAVYTPTTSWDTGTLYPFPISPTHGPYVLTLDFDGAQAILGLNGSHLTFNLPSDAIAALPAVIGTARPFGQFYRSGLSNADANLWKYTMGGTPPQTVLPSGVGSGAAAGHPSLSQHPRSGVGRPIILQGGGSHPRNRLIDRSTGEIYPWPVNHETEDSVKTLGRRLTRSGISASGRLTSSRKVFLIRHPAHPGPAHLILHGSFIDRAQLQYQKFRDFFNASDDRTFDYIDASGDSYHVAIVNFDARRKASPARLDASFFTYSLEVEVLDVNQGSYKGFLT